MEMVSITSGIVHFYFPLFVHLNSIIYIWVEIHERWLQESLPFRLISAVWVEISDFCIRNLLQSKIKKDCIVMQSSNLVSHRGLEPRTT